MKRLLSLLLIGFTLTATAQTSKTLTEAQKAYTAGDIVTAKALFESVLAQDPKNVAARNYLKRIAADEKQVAPGATAEKKFQALILPKVEFNNASFSSVLDALRQHAGKASKGQLEPNFVILPGVDTMAPVTLKLNHIPFTDALRYVCLQANAVYKVEQHAITIHPKAVE